MLYCNVLITIMSIIAGYAASSHILLALMLAVFGFLFSMLTVYGVRTSSVGIAGLIVMILSLQTPMHGWDIWEHGISIFIGGTWYLLFSLLLYKIRPYKIIQQVLGDFIMDVGEYLKTRGLFYDTNPEYDKTYQLLLQEQINVQAEQTLLSDILFKFVSINGKKMMQPFLLC
ncbi:MAG: hypothetical protein EOO00_10945 [Chitinophagaceae bacterium]|nr:MAG: hypothetical protein EOO00_10945 [Chitinophagaceae bacterium]